MRLAAEYVASGPVPRVIRAHTQRHPGRWLLARLGEGLSNAQIAARLYLSEARVKGYVSRMLDELGCANRAQAGLLAHDAPVSSARSPGR